MADKKISELNAATTLTGVEVLPVVQDGETKKATGAILSTDPSIVAALDIGTAPNEVPLNQYLGALAYSNVAMASVPASATAAGIMGQVAQDGSYLYVCTADNTWKRVAIATW